MTQDNRSREDAKGREFSGRLTSGHQAVKRSIVFKERRALRTFDVLLLITGERVKAAELLGTRAFSAEDVTDVIRHPIASVGLSLN